MSLKKIADKKRNQIFKNKTINIKENKDKGLKPLYDELVGNDKVITQRGGLIYLSDGLWLTPDGDIVELGR